MNTFLLALVALVGASAADADAQQIVTFKLKGLTGDSTLDVVVEMHPEWSPIGAAHFVDLVDAGFYDGARFFRVIGDFIAQFGLNSEQDSVLVGDLADTLEDDPEGMQSNTACTLTYATAGPSTRDHQIFINYADNAFLDSQGFTPFGIITEGCEEAIAGIAEVGEVISQGDLTADSPAAIAAYESQTGTTVSYIASASVSTGADVVVADSAVTSEEKQVSASVSRDTGAAFSMVVAAVAVAVVLVAAAVAVVMKAKRASSLAAAAKGMDASTNSATPCVPGSNSLSDFPATII